MTFWGTYRQEVQEWRTRQSICCRDVHASGFYSVATQPSNYLQPFPSLHGQHSRRSRPASHPVALCHKGEALGLPPPETLTLNIEQYTLLYILLDGSIEGGRDLYVLMTMINGGIQGMFVQTRLPCTIQYPESHHAEISMWMKISVVKKDCGILTLSSLYSFLYSIVF